jgi:hypothetical protein
MAHFSTRLSLNMALALIGAAAACPIRMLGQDMPTRKPVWPSRHPVVACTADELARLRAAYHGDDERHRQPVAAMVTAGENALHHDLVFPPRGGQHNQWYQCGHCQIALTTVASDRHRCPRCNQEYSGEPYDDVIFGHIHHDNLRHLHNAAWSYALTDDPKFANFARQVLLGYARRYRQYPYHTARRGNSRGHDISGGHLFSQTLTEAAALATHIAPAYDLIHDAPVMTDDDHASIRAGLLLPMLENISRKRAGKSNWQTWHNAAMLWGGAVLRDETWIIRAIADPEHGFRRQMTISVSREGMWHENSWDYHFYALRAMVLIAEGARRLGINLWDNPQLRAMISLPVHYLMPDGSLPRFGNAVGTNIAAIRASLEFACHSDDDANLRRLLAPEPTWDSIMLGREPPGSTTATALPHQGSEVFPGAGHAILRTEGAAGLVAVMTFGPYGAHGHFDKLSFVFFGFGQELGVDPGRAASQAYRLPIHREWYQATISHNTVLVNRFSQRPGAAQLQNFTASRTHAVATAICDQAYPGVIHRRTLALTPNYLLVCDQLTANSARHCDWLYHNRGQEATCAITTTTDIPDKTFSGREYLANLRAGATNDTIHIQFRDQDVTTHLTMAAAPGTQVLVGDGPGASVDDRVPLAMISRHGTQITFAAVIEPTQSDRPPTVSAVRITERDGTFVVEIRQGDATDTVQLDAAGRVLMQRDGMTILTGK